MNMNNKQYYEPAYDDPEKYHLTFDLGISACLISSGIQVIHLNRDNPSKVLFVFKKNKKLKEVIEAYYSDGLKINPRLLFDSLKLLKNRIHSSE